MVRSAPGCLPPSSSWAGRTGSASSSWTIASSRPPTGGTGGPQAILKALLPVGHRGDRAGGEPAASGRRSAEGRRLVRPRRRLRLIVSTDSTARRRTPRGPAPHPRGRRTDVLPALHDYLVRPIRLWLDRDQGSGRKASEARLERITAVWPSAARGTTPRRWRWRASSGTSRRADGRPTSPRLMGARSGITRPGRGGRAAGRGRGGGFLHNRVAAGLLVRSVHADFGDLPALISDLEPHRGLVIRGLEAYEHDHTGRAPPRRGAV
ncbi:MAG: hypothetical protein WKF75_02770 [Singulisphaera sp.]